MQKQNLDTIHTSLGKIKRGVRAYILTYAKSDSQLLFNAMYYQLKQYLLRRKYEKFKGFILNDPYARITVDARVL